MQFIPKIWYWDASYLNFVSADFQLFSMDNCIFQDGRFDIYDLLFDCRYNLRMETVNKLGNKGRNVVVQFDTPSCGDTTVVGQLEPDCPTDGELLGSNFGGGHSFS